MRSEIERMIVSVAHSHRSEWSTVSAYGTHAGAATTMLYTVLYGKRHKAQPPVEDAHR